MLDAFLGPVFIGGLEGPDELLDQPHYNNPWRDGVHSSEHRAGAGRSRRFREGETIFTPDPVHSLW